MTKIIETAEQAAAILENPLFFAAFREIDRKTIAAWRVATDPDERERLHVKQAALSEIKHELLQHIEEAKKQVDKERPEVNHWKEFINNIKASFNFNSKED